MPKNNKQLYKVGIYTRLSKEDGDKVQSNSIQNQKSLIKEFLKSKPEIRIYAEYADDGYSGVNFERPDFIKMMQDIKEEKINCIIVKDFSRFGRNHIEVGKYIERFFPFVGVRFISINDNYDSTNEDTPAQNLVVPLKFMFDDNYCRDISIKTRSQFEIMRKKGEFIGSFATFGYKKSTEDKHKLVIDRFAANVVKDIFKWKMEGMSNPNIAMKLNELGVSSPAEYKKQNGDNYKTSFQTSSQSLWSPVAVSRILKNEVYIGVLIQGKEGTPNHKVKKRMAKLEKDWVRIENSHEAIISRHNFEIVNSVIHEETRTAPSEDTVYMFSGILKCGDCSQNMIRKVVPSGNKKYIYYVCSTHRRGDGCKSHMISSMKIESAVLIAIKEHIKNIIQVERMLKAIENLPLKKDEIFVRNEQISKKREVIETYQNRILVLYEKLTDGIIDKAEFKSIKKNFTDKCENAQKSIENIKKEINELLCNFASNHWIEHFKQYQNVSELSRNIVITMISKIFVYENERIKIRFKYNDEFESAVNFIEGIEKIAGTDSMKETM